MKLNYHIREGCSDFPTPEDCLISISPRKMHLVWWKEILVREIVPDRMHQLGISRRPPPQTSVQNKKFVVLKLLFPAAMAGNIIPAIATTNAVIAGLIVMQGLNVLSNNFNKCKTVSTMSTLGFLYLFGMQLEDSSTLLKRRSYEQVFALTSFPWQVLFAGGDGTGKIRKFPLATLLVESWHASLSTKETCQG